MNIGGKAKKCENLENMFLITLLSDLPFDTGR